MKLTTGFLAATTLAGCVSTGFSEPPAPPARAMLAGETPRAHVAVREERGEIEIVAGPFHVPATNAGTDHQHHSGDESMMSPLVVVPWPVDGGLAGFRMAAYTADGTQQPREILHHVIGVNFSRRQLLYPAAERLFGFGTETPDVRLPDFVAVPISRGDSIGVYAMWNNATGVDLHGVHLQIILPYASADRERENALPIYLDTSYRIADKNSYDLPPGRSVRSYEFELPVSGALLAAGGHLHDYGVELRLEEVATGRLITRLVAEVDPQGRVTGVQQRVYRRLFKLLDARLRLEAGVRYRVVGVYENRTGETIPDGGMAHIVGLFVPDDLAGWPRPDTTDADYLADLAGLPPSIEDAHVHY